MWMLNTLIPLDMLFFDARGKVVYIHQNAKPNDLTVISSGQNVQGVIELNGGTVKKNDIKQGSQVYFLD